MQLPNPLNVVGLVPVLTANVTGCPVALSVTVTLFDPTVVTVPVIGATSSRLPPACRTAAVLNGTLTEVGDTAGDSSQTVGVAAAVHEFGTESFAVVPGSTFTAAVAVPKIIRTLV